MNLRQLRTLVTARELGSFAAAGDRLGLSHAAVSIQMQQLEAMLKARLFDRRSKPITLTREGLRIADLASEVLGKIESIEQLAAGEEFRGSITIGIIPTCVGHLLPLILNALRQQFSGLQVKIKSGLSAELAQAVIRGEIDYALLTSPTVEMPELSMTEIAAEPLYVIAAVGQPKKMTDHRLLASMPYIAFNKRTWVGQQIATRLQQRDIQVNETIEINSLEAIENLVTTGFGVSIVPKRLRTELDQSKLLCVPFGSPVETRKLSVIRLRQGHNAGIDDAVRLMFTHLGES
ncbi:MAG: DNA-binding transcriptional LysR family regulator [Planctomycetota bacterium]|jgi:DNA-binding transcriptional LysR family regulator